MKGIERPAAFNQINCVNVQFGFPRVPWILMNRITMTMGPVDRIHLSLCFGSGNARFTRILVLELGVSSYGPSRVFGVTVRNVCFCLWITNVLSNTIWGGARICTYITFEGRISKENSYVSIARGFTFNQRTCIASCQRFARRVQDGSVT